MSNVYIIDSKASNQEFLVFVWPFQLEIQKKMFNSNSKCFHFNGGNTDMGLCGNAELRNKKSWRESRFRIREQ